MKGDFYYLKPESLVEALECLAENGRDCKVLAGGTDLIVSIHRNLESPRLVMDIKQLPQLNVFHYTPGEGLFIGAAIRVNQVCDSEVVKEKYTALAQAASVLATHQLRNRATLVGNICNASPGADLAPPLLAFEARVKAVSVRGTREIPLQEFFTGVKKTVLKPDELITGVIIPEPLKEERSLYLKQGRIKGHDLAIVGVAVRVSGKGNKKFYLALSSVAPTPLRLVQLEEDLASVPLTEVPRRAAKEVSRYISPISDVRASAEYRIHMAGILLERALTGVLGGEDSV